MYQVVEREPIHRWNTVEPLNGLLEPWYTDDDLCSIFNLFPKNGAYLTVLYPIFWSGLRGRRKIYLQRVTITSHTGVCGGLRCVTWRS